MMRKLLIIVALAMSAATVLAHEHKVLGTVTSAISTAGDLWPEIPSAPLLRLLARHGKVVRSDRGGYSPRKHWVDFHIPC